MTDDRELFVPGPSADINAFLRGMPECFMPPLLDPEIIFRRPDQPTLEVSKVSGYVPVSDDLLMDMGAIPDTRPPIVISRRTRIRWWVARQRLRLGRTIGSWIAGAELRDYWDED